VITSRRIPTGRADGPDAVAERIVAAVADQHAAATQLGRTVRGAGVVVPGIVDEVRGIAVFSANLGFRQVPLRDLIEKAGGRPGGVRPRRPRRRSRRGRTGRRPGGARLTSSYRSARA